MSRSDRRARGANIAANATGYGSGPDPTATTMLRRRWEGALYREFRDLKGLIRAAVAERDVFGLHNDAPRGVRGTVLSGQQRRLPGRGAFDFPTDDEKHNAFMEWLREQEREGVLETNVNPAVGASTLSSAVNDPYVRASYQKGVEHADGALKSAGLSMPREDIDRMFRQPVHANAVASLYGRSYRDLEGVTRAMDAAISRELAEGFVQGYGPEKIARNINEKVDNVGLTRARTLARTETVRAHNYAALNRYEQMGVEGVKIRAEWSTADDERVCEECWALEGRIYSIDGARGKLPMHPNCRCAVIPVVTDVEEEVEE